MIICLLTVSMLLINDTAALEELWKRRIIEAACQRNPQLPFCSATEKINDAVETEQSAANQGRKEIRNDNPPEETEKSENDGDPSLRVRCLKVQQVVSKHCDGTNTGAVEIAKCRAYFRDCVRYIPQTDPLYSIAKVYGSQVGVNVWQYDVNGIPYYPINEEGGIGAQQALNVPFGTWGGGYEGHVGVRDYWSQYQQAGANWYDGLYGYQSGWSVPLVQSLGVEGNGGTRVAVPLYSRDFGKIGVDNGYGVGPYYSGNRHIGVNWKEGQVNDQLGLKIPFVGVGYNFGQAVSFPSIDTFADKIVNSRQ